jgi:hypothetical protein
MLFSPQQHMKMAGLLHKKAKAEADPKVQKRLSQFANVHRTLARKSSEKKPKPATKA